MISTTIRKGLKLVPKRERKKGGLITLLLVATSIFDLFSIASFFPLILLIVSPDSPAQHKLLSWLYSVSGLTNEVHAGLLLCAVAIIFIIVKTAFTFWVNYLKARYAYQIAGKLADNVLETFLYQTYRAYTSADYTRELNRISNIPLTFANNILIPLGTILSEGLISAMLLIIISVIDPLLFVYLAGLMIPFILIYRTQKKKIAESSSVIKEAYPRLLKQTLQGIDSFLEIKSYQKEFFFQTKFRKTYQELTGVFAHDNVRNGSISRITEMIAAILLASIIVYTLLFYENRSEALIVLAMYGGISFRIIPSANRIISSIVLIRNHEYTIDELQPSLVNHPPRNVSKITHHKFRESLTFENVSFSYHRDSNVLQEINLQIRKGEKLLVTGKSGTGKTTLLLLMLRFLRPERGRILLDGVEVQPTDDEAFRQMMCFVPQHPCILDGSILENIAFGIPKAEIDKGLCYDILQRLDLSTWVEQLPDKIHTVIGEKGSKISGGQRQRIALARALYHNREVFLLDEITNSLDAKSEQEVLACLDHLAKMGKSILMISHKIELQSYFDSVYNLDQKRQHKTSLVHSDS